MKTIGPQVSTRVNDPASVDAAILSRFSARAYLPQAVERSVLQEVLSVAARSPSGTNTQPWKVYVLQGAKRDELVAKTCAAHDAISANPALASEYAESYDYYPEKWVSPYIDRRRECGFGLYGVLRPTGASKKRKFFWCWACMRALSPLPMPRTPYRPKPHSRRRSM